MPACELSRAGRVLEQMACRLSAYARKMPDLQPECAQGAVRCGRCGAQVRAGCGPGLCAACSLERALTGIPDPPEPGEIPGANAGATAGIADAGQEFGHYRLKRIIAVGGMGTVWEASQTGLNRPVALKMLRSGRFASAVEIQRFHVEAGAAARLTHPNIVPIYEVGEHDGLQYFSMQLVPGSDLAREFKAGALAPQRIARLLIKVARAVDYAHRHGVLHRDLKPANILLDAEDEPHLTDFGLAKASWLDSTHTHTADLLGTPDYMSPEQAAGRAKAVSTAADVWSLGAILYEALAGKAPFHGPTWMETLRRVVNEEPVTLRSLNPAIDADLEVICLKCLDKDESGRYATAGELADELDRWLDGRPIRARPLSRTQRLRKWARRHPWSLAAILAVVGSMILGTTVSTVQWRRAARMNTDLVASDARLRSALNAATSRTLASQARVELPSSPSLALLLAVESVEATRRHDGNVETTAFNTLLSVLQEVGGRLADPGPRGPPPLDLASKLRAVSALSPDSRWLALAGGDGVVRLFDGYPSYGREPRGLLEAGGGRALAVAWNNDGRTVFTLGGSGEVRRWDLPDDFRTNATAAKPRSFGVPTPVAQERGGIACGTFVRGDAGVISWAATATSEGLIRLWPLRSEGGAASVQPRIVTADLPPTNLKGRVAAMLASEDGAWLAIRLNGTDQEVLALARLGAEDGTPTSLLAETVQAGGDFIRDMAFSPDGKWLAVGRGDGHGYLVPLAGRNSKPPVIQFASHEKEVRDVAFSSDSRWVASVGFDPEVSLISVESAVAGRPAIQHRHEKDRSYGVVFSPDDRWLCVLRSDGAVDAWEFDPAGDLVSPVRLRGPEFAEGELMFSPDGGTLWAVDLFGTAWRWPFDGSPAAASPQSSRRLGGEARCVAWSHDGSLLACAVDDGSVHVWEADMKRTIGFPAHDRATAVAFSADDRWLASIGHDGQLKVWETSSLASRMRTGGSGAALVPRYVLPTGTTRTLFARKLAWHPHGRLFATSGDGLLFEWDLTRPDPGSSVRSHRLHSIDYMLNAVVVSPDGKWLAVGRHGWDDRPVPGSKQFGNMVLLFGCDDPSALRPVDSFRCNHLAWGGLAFSPDSRWLACGAEGKPALLWDLHAAEPGRAVREAPFAGALFEGVAFSPDGATLALADWGGRIHLWPFQGRDEEARSLSLLRGVHSCAFAPGGQRLATAGQDGRVQVWDLDIDKLVALARQTAGRSLSATELKRFGLSAPGE